MGFYTVGLVLGCWPLGKLIVQHYIPTHVLFRGDSLYHPERLRVSPRRTQSYKAASSQVDIPVLYQALVNRIMLPRIMPSGIVPIGHLAERANPMGTGISLNTGLHRIASMRSSCMLIPFEETTRPKNLHSSALNLHVLQ